MSSKFQRRTRNTGGKSEEVKPKCKRDLSGMLPRPGNNRKHGGYELAQKWVSGELDMRTREARSIRKFEQDIVKELGGLEACTPTQKVLLNRASELLIILTQMSKFVVKTGVLSKDGNLVKCLRSSFIAYTNSFRRTLTALHELRADLPPGLLPPVQINVNLVDDSGRPFDIKQLTAPPMKKVGEGDINKPRQSKPEDEKT